MRALVQGIKEAPLLRKVWFQCFSFSVFALALLKVAAGYEEFHSYRVFVESCISANLEEANDTLAKNIKAGSQDNVALRLNSIEFSCAFPQMTSLQSSTEESIYKQANFFWIAEQGNQELLRIGKNLLKGPVYEQVYPLSIWSEGNSGDYWVGSISIQLYYGDFLSSLIQDSWSEFSEVFFLLLVLSLFCFFWLYYKIVRPNRQFIGFLSQAAPSAASVRKVVAGRDDEIGEFWRTFLSVVESGEVERFEFEAQIRDLEFHISKIERGQAGQTLSTERASLDIKNALHRSLALQARAAHEGDLKSAILFDYLTAVLSVSTNLHERSQLESGDIELNDIDFNIRILLAQVYLEYRARMDQRGIAFEFDVQDDLPVFVTGDPEKIKRVMRNAFKRSLLQSNIQSIVFKAFYDTTSRQGSRFVFEMKATPELGVATSPYAEPDLSRKAPEQGPTPMLEMLCFVIGARWTFTEGPQGELTQSLTLPLPLADSPATYPIHMHDIKSTLPGNVLVYDLCSQGNSSLYKAASALFGSVDYYSDCLRMLDRIDTLKLTPDLVVVSDVTERMQLHDFLNSLRYLVPAATPILMISDAPQIGDSILARDAGVHGFLSRTYFERRSELMLRGFCYYLQTQKRQPQLFTRFSLLDMLGPDEAHVLPMDLVDYSETSVLLISDEHVCIEFTRIQASRFGTRLIHFDSAFDAMDAYRQERFDLVVVDDSFEDIDAITVIEMLRQIERQNENKRRTPIVALVSHADDKIDDIYMKVGANDVICKSTLDGRLKLLFERKFSV